MLKTDSIQAIDLRWGVWCASLQDNQRHGYSEIRSFFDTSHPRRVLRTISEPSLPTYRASVCRTDLRKDCLIAESSAVKMSKALTPTFVRP